MPDREARGYQGGARGTRAARALLGPADCPLEAMREEHFRQRRFCLDMEALAAARFAKPALALALLANLCRDRPLHHADEEEGLFPILRHRAAADDDIGGLLDRLSGDHARTMESDGPILSALARIADGALPTPRERDGLRALAQAERRHMTIENAVVLPLARLRLTAGDRAALLSGMRARRARPLPAEGPCRRIAWIVGKPDERTDR